MTEGIISLRDTLRFEVKMLHTLRLQNYLGSLKDEIVYSLQKAFYSYRISVLQLVWTDRNGNYPWDKDYEEEFIYLQPFLDRYRKVGFR